MPEIKAATYTPGPWRVVSMCRTNNDFPTKHPHFEIGAKDSATWIAHVLCFSDAHVETEYEANARLIAAAPELYDALKALYDETAEYIRINDLGDAHHNCSMKSAANALAKAEGGTPRCPTS